jgi:cardiolipin synthase A/B
MQSLWLGVTGSIGWIIGASFSVLTIVVVVRALTRPNRAASARVAWVSVLVFLPVLGVISYFFLGETSIGRARARRMREAEAALPLPSGEEAALATASPQAQQVLRLTASINGLGALHGNTIDLQRDEAAAVAALVADIDAATRSVHINFYIWLDDHDGALVAAAVARAAARGVHCRILVDALGSRAFLKSAPYAAMIDAGTHCVAALGDLLRWGRLAVGRPDLRNHRKIVVIDDEVAYMGSQNCASPSFSPKPNFAPWVDVFFRVTGPLVTQHQWLFLSAWLTEVPQDGPAVGAPTLAEHAGAPGTSELDTTTQAHAGPAVAPLMLPPSTEPALAAAFGTGPTVRAGAMSEAFVAMVSAAYDELIVTTPYFVPDDALLAALCAAPRRGVETTLIMPARNDSWFVKQASHSAYDRLLKAGVRIYEYPLGLLHSKTMTVDGQLCLVGSSNMDRRSLELNYENNVVVADPDVTAAVRERQLQYLVDSVLLDPDVSEHDSLWRRLVQNTVAMLAPLL